MVSEERIVIIERLLESKAITFREALKLVETEKEYIYNYWPLLPYVAPSPTWTQPWDTVTYTTQNTELTNN